MKICRFKKLLFILFGSFTILFINNSKIEAALHIDTSYNGKYINHVGYKKILADLPFVYQEALQKINYSLGIPIIDNLRVIIIFSDKLTYNGMRLRGKRRSIIKDDKVLHYIYLDLEFLLEGSATLIEEMTHELTHAIMAEIMGLEKYDRLPMWIKEGTAVHAADQGLARIKALLRRGFDINLILNEDESLDNNPISLEQYVANYLKVQFLLKTYGREAFYTFINMLLSSGNLSESLKNAFNGLTEAVLEKYAKDYIAKTLISTSYPKHAHEQLMLGMKYFEEKEYLSARLALTDALYGGLSEEDYNKAAYLLAECFIQERNHYAALNMLQKVDPKSKFIPKDRFIFLNAYTKYAMGLISEAYIEFREAFQVSKSTAIQESALYYLIRILAEVGNKVEALKLLDYLKINFPNSMYIALAERLVNIMKHPQIF